MTNKNKRTKPNKTRHNLRYEKATWVDLDFLAKELEKTYTEVMEEALNRGMAWIAKKNGLELPSQAKTRIRKKELYDFLHQNKKATPAQVNQRDPELNEDDTPNQEEMTDEEAKNLADDIVRQLSKK